MIYVASGGLSETAEGTAVLTRVICSTADRITLRGNRVGKRELQPLPWCGARSNRHNVIGLCRTDHNVVRFAQDQIHKIGNDQLHITSAGLPNRKAIRQRLTRPEVGDGHLRPIRQDKTAATKHIIQDTIAEITEDLNDEELSLVELHFIAAVCNDIKEHGEGSGSEVKQKTPAVSFLGS